MQTITQCLHGKILLGKNPHIKSHDSTYKLSATISVTIQSQEQFLGVFTLCQESR